MNRKGNGRNARGAVDDLDIDPSALTGEGLAQYLETRLQETLAEIFQSPAWQLLVHPASSPDLVQALLREIDLERLLLQPAVSTSLKATIDALPSNAPSFLVETLQTRLGEIGDLPGASARAYARRGGSVAQTGDRMVSPSVFAAIGSWRSLAGDPHLTIGALYLVDGLLPLVHGMIEMKASPRGNAARKLTDMAHRLGAFLEHTSDIRPTIVAMADRSPKARLSIAYGFEYLRQTTPLPIWEAARLRAVRQDGAEQAAAE